MPIAPLIEQIEATHDGIDEHKVIRVPGFKVLNKVADGICQK